MNAPVPRDLPASPCGFDQIQALVAEDMAAVNALIRDSLRSEVLLINQIGEHIIGSGGKRLRPMLVLLSARACGYQGRDHIALAAIIEFIHTATLLHDDVVDESDLRRGRSTANAVWGNAASVLVGDFLYSRSFQMMVGLRQMPIMGILADTTNAIAEGEVLQLLNQGNPDVAEADYLRVIHRKTATLFEAATRLGALLSGADEQTQNQVASYGKNLGIAFQIADDLLDYTADAQTMGKNLGDDLAEGKPTLPLLRVLQTGTDAQRYLIRDVIEHGGLARLDEVLAALTDSDALDYSRQRAQEYCDLAEAGLDGISDNLWTRALRGLAQYALSRRY